MLPAAVAEHANPVITDELPSLFPVHVCTLMTVVGPRHLDPESVTGPAGSAMAGFAGVCGPARPMTWNGVGGSGGKFIESMFWYGVNDASLPWWWTYPIKCGNGHAWGPGKVIVSYV